MEAAQEWGHHHLRWLVHDCNHTYVKQAKKHSSHADYQWHHVVHTPVGKSPQKAIDAFLDVFSEVYLEPQSAALSPPCGTDLLYKLRSTT